MADDLVQYLDSEVSQPVHGVGHSMGAVVTLLASIKRPERFHSLTLIDPVVLPALLIMVSRLMPDYLKKHMPIIKKTLGREDSWPSAQQAFDYHRNKKVFSRFSDEVLWDYINAGTACDKQHHYRLTYSKEWEAHCYSCAPYVLPLLKKNHVPMMIIRGENSNVISPQLWSRWKKTMHQHQLVEIAGVGHLLPFEAPEKVAEVMRKFIQQHPGNK